MNQLILNPDTNRWVSIYSKTGKKVLKKYVNYLNQSGGNKSGRFKKKIKSTTKRSSALKKRASARVEKLMPQPITMRRILSAWINMLLRH